MYRTYLLKRHHHKNNAGFYYQDTGVDVENVFSILKGSTITGLAWRGDPHTPLVAKRTNYAGTFFFAVDTTRGDAGAHI